MGEHEGQRYEGQADVKIVLVADKPHAAEGARGSEEEDAASKKWQRQHSRRQLWFNGLLCLFTGIYAGVSIYQLRAIRDQGEQAKKTLETAERSWAYAKTISLPKFSDTGDVEFDVVFENLGRGPALYVYMFIVGEIREDSPPDDYDYWSAPTAPPDEHRPVTFATWMPNLHYSPPPRPVFLGPIQNARIVNGEGHFFMHGTVYYWDQFGNPHHTGFCAQYISRRNTDSGGSLPAHNEFCRTHNFAD